MSKTRRKQLMDLALWWSLMLIGATAGWWLRGIADRTGYEQAGTTGQTEARQTGRE